MKLDDRRRRTWARFGIGAVLGVSSVAGVVVIEALWTPQTAVLERPAPTRDLAGWTRVQPDRSPRSEAAVSPEVVPAPVTTDLNAAFPPASTVRLRLHDPLPPRPVAFAAAPVHDLDAPFPPRSPRAAHHRARLDALPF